MRSNELGHRGGSQGREYEGGPTGRPDERNSTSQQYGQRDRFDPEGEDDGYSSPPAADRYSGQRSWPKGYTRSDERIRDDICERLSHCGLDVSDVSVEVAQGRVILEGSVRDRHAKHAIEDCADDCSGVQDVDNRIRVLAATNI